ncbi:MAG: ABC transporter, ATP-binding protein, partial [uncultured bacterium]
NQEGTTIILTTHYLEEAEQLCKHVAIIDHGRIIEHANMKTLISRLNMHTVILDIDKPQAKYLHLIEYQCQPIDDTSIEVIIRQGQSVNHLFHLLSQKNINVISMRNKTNRLEELFMHLIEKNKKSSAENP